MNHVLAGYRLASRDARQDWQDVGLPQGELVSLSGCVTTVVADDWDEWFGDPTSAERARAGRSDLHVLEVGIAAQDVQPLPADVREGGWDVSAGSLPERLARAEPVTATDVLGFELVGYDSGTWHTWTCLGGLVDDVRRATGVRPGRWGLVQDESQARVAADWLTASGLGDPKVFLWVTARLANSG
ncbi:hypothetical protein FHX81_2613 [Saccharothrix saharensis]|uniref:Uncharacterized protein n=1 Tax=Saccharothrix saharensis TaxID=571190 RepID=A0A543JBQ9_9PSEU|nr:hypothetical protein [Saccharothrix saharensis]TQM80285.1 hypothetical protein FHX81_2613 [Saccharothrix saharensis]